jgi:multiple sugar transport system substrate-binding protein
MKRRNLAGASLILFLAVTAGCGTADTGAANNGGEIGDSASPAKTVKPAEPMTLSVGVASFATSEFDEVFAPATAQKFPNITLEKYDIGSDGATYEKNIMAKSLKPDIMFTGLGTNFLIPLKQTGLSIDMAPLAKAANLDLTRFDKARINRSYNLDGDPDLTVIPYSVDVAALYYNKDIFDRFGVQYPKDRMTWDQVIDLAKKVTRTEDGVQFRGLESDAVDRSASQLGLLTVNPKTDKAAVNSEGWKQIFSLMKQVYDIPGNGKLVWFNKARDEFIKTKDLAMWIGINPVGFDTASDLNWDLVTFPVFANSPNTMLTLGGHAFAVTSLSEHKKEAFDLVKWWVSDEMQKKLSAKGLAPALNTPEVREAFGADRSEFKGKNKQAWFALQPAEPEDYSEYEPNGIGIIRSSFQNMIKNQTDVNTALRTAEEQINIKIEQEKSK